VIGVDARPVELPAVREFFELFKTDWEVAVPGTKYEVVLSTAVRPWDIETERLIVYASAEQAVDREAGVAVQTVNGTTCLWGESTIPIYGVAGVFRGAANPGVVSAQHESVDYRAELRSRVVRRIGYDLFLEVERLLTDGQPASWALVPTLELHIALLRSILLEMDVSFLEVPPRPFGRDFIACLTHDLDFISLRRHRFDRTLAGFVLRASLGTLVDVFKRRRSLADAGRNWLAVCSLPLVFLGVARDPWRPFEAYASIEQGRPSTFFVVPLRDEPGVGPDGARNAKRAVRYQASEIPAHLESAVTRGNEIAVHGIDAWRDEGAGRKELKQVGSATRGNTTGVRMHWLYFSPDSPRNLAAAGYTYDSTWGYNDAVGYRAGTSQVFQFLGEAPLFELPLSIMDSALFYPGRMNLREKEAAPLCRGIVENSRRFGGTLVVNWHDRSLSPERLWGGFYRQLLAEAGREDRVWWGTARQAVDWFHWRRSIQFTHTAGSSSVAVHAPSLPPNLPAGTVRVHRPTGASATVQDVRLDGSLPMAVTL
jgi:hypothetical protein